MQSLPGELTGAPLPAYETIESAVGEGIYRADEDALDCIDGWEMTAVDAQVLRTAEDATYATTDETDARCDFSFNGQKVELTYSIGPDHGIWAVEVDGEPLVDEDTGKPLTVDGYNATVRYGARKSFMAEEPGEHVLSLVNTGDKNADSKGTTVALTQVQVLPPIRQSNLGVIIGLVIGLEVVGAVFALLLGRPLFSRLAEKLDTRRSIVLALIVFSAIAIWGFFLNSVIEFWFLAWMVAIVLGGSQALSRSLYASMSPAAKSGEFFGMYGVMEKFSAIIGPLIFAAAATTFDSSRPAVLSLILLFFIGIFLLQRVDIDEGRRIAREVDAAALG